MVEFEGKFDKRVNNKMAEWQTNKTQKAIKWLAIIFVIISALMCISGILSDLETDEDIYYFSIGIVGLIFWLVFPKIVRKATQKSQEKLYNETYLLSEETFETYKFDEEKVYIFTKKGDKYRSAVETSYDYFSNVLEDGESYMLFISSIQCHIVFKDQLKSGTLEEFEGYLHKYFQGDKYKKSTNDKNKPKFYK